jgi:hypothetical protein
MTLISTVAQAMQTVLTDKANKAAHDSGFCQRASALGGATFVQAAVFACLAKPLPTLSDFTQKAAAVGCVVKPQAFDQRFTACAADCLRLVLAEAVAQVIVSQPPLVPLLQRFTALAIQDSTTLVLPDCLKDLWQGNGGSTTEGTQAAVKFQVRLDLCSGQMTGPFPDHGRSSDQRSAIQSDEDLPPGALRIADLGYFDLDVFARLQERNVFYLSKLQFGTAVFTSAGQRLRLLQWLKEQTQDVVDTPVLLGSKQRLPCRLVAIRVPESVARKREERLRKDTQKRGKKVSAERLELCAWTVLVTNLPVELASAAEMVVLARCRWQIELLFKLWKSDGGLDKSGSHKPWRIMCEIYAKLIGLVVQHWLLVAGCWQNARRSLRKAAKVVRDMALALAGALADRLLLEAMIHVIVRCLAAGIDIHKSAKDPRTYQLFEKPTIFGSPLT